MEPAPAEPPARPVSAPPSSAPPGARPGAWARLRRFYGFDEGPQHTRVTWILAGGTALSYIGPGSIIPLLVLYFTGVVGIPLAFMSVVIITQEVTRAIASPYLGGLSDRVGRKPLMLAGLLLQATTFLAYLFVTDRWTLLAASVLYGLGHAPYHPSLNALVSDLTPKARRAAAFGLVHMAKNLGYAIGIGFGAVLLTVTGGYTTLFIAGATFPLLYALIVAVAVREPPRRAVERPRNPFAAVATALRSGRFVAFLLLAMGVFVAWGQLVWVLPVFIRDGLGFEERIVSLMMLANAAMILVLQVPVSHRADAWRRERGLAVAGFINALAYVVFALVAVVAVTSGDPRIAIGGLLVGTLVFTVGEMLDTPLLFAMASDLAPPEVTGGAMGVLAFAAPAGLALAPALGDYASATWGWAGAWVVFALLVGIGGAGFLLLARTEPAGDNTTSELAEATPPESPG